VYVCMFTLYLQSHVHIDADADADWL